MIAGLQVWWHRVILRHPQTDVMNGPTEAGVWCYCHGIEAVAPRWFPSDGGNGR